MREYSFYIPIEGLYKEEEDANGLYVLRNLIPDEKMWKTPEWPSMLWNSASQIIRGTRHTFRCTETAVHTVNETTFASTAIASASAGGRWQLADFGTVFILTNGVSTVYRKNTQSGFVTGSLLSPHIGAVCDHWNMRLVYGDIGTEQNLVGWSAIGGDDISNILAGTSLTSYLSARNESNIIAMPWRGRVLSLLPMGEHVIVYGEDGISALRPFDANYGIVSVQNLPSDLGVAGRWAVAGGADGHLFFGSDNELWFISPDMKAERLGYSWLPSSSAICYDGQEKRWWITGAESYVFTQYGLGGPMSVRPVSLARIGGTLYGTGATHSDTEYPIQIMSNMFDMSDTGQKRITFVRVAANSVTEQMATVRYRYARDAALQEHPWRVCAKDGSCYIGAALVDGQVGYNAKTTDMAQVKRIEVRYQSHDRRTIRGTRGMPDTETDA